MIYCDTSSLFALYNRADRFNAQAEKLAARLRQPIALTLLGELELLNGLYRGVSVKMINLQERDAILRQFSDDEADGILIRYAVDQTELYARARDLSKKFTAKTLARSLDILHVASAQLLKADKFISFDTKQRNLAQKAGVNLFPQVVEAKPV